MNNLKKTLTTLLTALALVFVGGTVLAEDATPTSGTITINDAAQGQTYEIYKLFDATVDGSGAISYKLPDGKTKENFGGDTWFDVDAKGNVTAKEGADVSTDAFRTWAMVYNTTAIQTTVAASNTVEFTGLAFGYYFITTTNHDSDKKVVLTVDSTNPNATVNDKNTTAPNIPDDNNGGGKKIVVDGKTVDSTTVKVGDTVNYQIKFTATNYVTISGTDSKQIVSYTITDTPKNLTIDESSIEVTVGGAATKAAVTKTVKDGVMTIVLTWVGENNATVYNSPSEVIVKYNATVTKGAADAAAANSATIGYNTSDKPNDTPTPVDPNHPTDDTTVTTYQFTLNKVDASGNQLTGATFKLYDTDNNTEIAVVKDGDYYRVAEKGETSVAIEVGSAVIKGLKGGTTYYLEETKSPNGYNILDDRASIEVKTDNSAIANVKNEKGTELPSTGSFGTKMFYLVGSVLLISALIFMISKRRMNNM